ncbi:hypothetical protein LBW12_05285 [Latilactobacillus curvatus]|uniref:phage tail assembly chaperone G n=1 Tax=Latilactobacillus curvatus TaxID=28038 RepID=UPI0020C7E605|nr:hypothetical protein [Latilactobacillus curvatus]MCP8859437.1 hypothetical protein [Latilactobacillus curvatus]
MIKIDLYDEKTGDTLHFEKTHVEFGMFKKIAKFNKEMSLQEAKSNLLKQKFDQNILTTAEEAEYLEVMSGSEIEDIERMETLIVELFNNPKVTTKTLESGLDLSKGIETLQKILNDAMGGIKADADHPAKK